MKYKYKYHRYYLHRQLKKIAKVNAREKQVSIPVETESKLTAKQKIYLKALINKSYSIQYSL